MPLDPHKRIKLLEDTIRDLIKAYEKDSKLLKLEIENAKLIVSPSLKDDAKMEVDPKTGKVAVSYNGKVVGRQG